jgi:DNA-binding transcriptional ArsR family regulator
MSTNLAITAKLMGDPGRAAILVSLMGGTARPAGELAAIGNVAPQTASGHLSRLLESGLLTVERQGRHRHYRLASAQVGEAIDMLF